MSVNRNVTVPTGSDPRVVTAPDPSAVRSVMVLLLGHGAKAAGQLADDREGERRVLEQNPLEVPRGERETRRGYLGYDLGDTRLAVEMLAFF